MRASSLAATSASPRLDAPRPPGIFRRYFARHPWVTDSLVAAIYLLCELAGIAAIVAAALSLTPASLTPGPIISSVAISLLLAVAMLFRRHFPLRIFAVMIVGAIVVARITGEPDLLGVMFALYAIAVYRSSKTAWLALTVALGVNFIDAWLRHGLSWSSWLNLSDISSEPELEWWQNFLLGAVVPLLIATLIGTSAGNRKRYLAALVGRAEQLERDLEQQTQIAAAEERARIAREMHDVIAHSVTVMVTLAEGAAATKNPEQARSAMLSTADAGRTALTEMRQLLGVLHDDDADAAALAPQPTISELPALVATYRAAGLPVSLSIEGEPVPGEIVQLAVYRVAQEALTNALRYASGASAVSVRVQREQSNVRVRVLDDGATAPVRPSRGARRGIPGLKKRVEVLGGTVTAGPGAAGGWMLEAVIPIEGEK